MSRNIPGVRTRQSQMIALQCPSNCLVAVGCYVLRGAGQVGAGVGEDPLLVGECVPQRFEDLMEFMDDEVLDPVAALSLNLKDLAACRIAACCSPQNRRRRETRTLIQTLGPCT